MASFDNKIFNAEVFGKYVDNVPNLRKNELLKAGVLNNRPDIAALFAAQTGGNYAMVPLKGNIGGAPVKYDGGTDITATSRTTFSQGMKVIGRAKAFEEKDFSYDIAGNVDFLATAGEVAEYWDTQDQNILLKTLQGIFAMSGTGNNDFVNYHTLNITEESDAANKVVGVTSLNKAIQKAGGDNKSAFSVAIMHSAVATNLENQQLLSYLKYTDANGVQRDLALGTWNGRLVMIDDSMPVTEEITTAETKGTYTLTFKSAFTTGKKFTLNGEEYAWVTADPEGNQFTGADVDAQGASLAPLLQTNNPAFTVAFDAASDKFTFTQRVGGTGAKPVLVDTDENFTPAGITAGVSGVKEVKSDTYVTYILGKGAFDYADCGAKVPYEAYRDALEDGGISGIASRQRKIFAPRGISFLDTSSVTPSDDDLVNGAKWGLVKDASNTVYYDHKAIPISRIISLG